MLNLPILLLIATTYFAYAPTDTSCRATHQADPERVSLTIVVYDLAGECYEYPMTCHKLHADWWCNRANRKCACKAGIAGRHLHDLLYLPKGSTTFVGLDGDPAQRKVYFQMVREPEASRFSVDPKGP